MKKIGNLLIFLILLLLVNPIFSYPDVEDTGDDIDDIESKITKPDLSLIIAIDDNPVLYLRQTLRTLEELLTDNHPIEIIIVPLGTINIENLDALHAVLTSRETYDKFKIMETIVDPLDSVPKAFNRGAKEANGDYFIFMTDLTEIPNYNTLSELLSNLEKEEVGVAGGKLLFPDETIYHAGIEFVLLKDPSVMSWAWGSNNLVNSVELAGVSHRLQGFIKKDSRASQEEEVPAVSKALFGVSASVFESIGGFNETYKRVYFDVDFCLRVSNELRKSVVYNPAAIALFNDKNYAEQEYSVLEWDPKEDNRLFNQKWGDYVRAEIESQYELQNFTLVWNMECGTGQVLGFTTESINFIMALHHRIRIKIEVAREDECKSELKKAGIPLDVRNTISRLIKREFPKSQDIITVLHRDPGRYSFFLTNPLEYTIGRSMYETNKIPSDWVPSCNSWKIDKIWVPTEFNRVSFHESGVNETKLDVIPELVDTDHFNPTIHSALLSIPQKDDYFKFLTVMKWEPRKAWDVLLQAYFEEFSKKEKVALYFVSRLDNDAKNLYDKFVADYVEKKGLKSSNTLPKVILLNAMFPETKLPSLYKSVNALVLPSHGEGWGLPLVEAMSMSLPVIATNWSGPTGFMTEENSFLVNIDGLVNSTTPGHLWANPSIRQLKQQMRKVFRNKPEITQKAKKARKDMTEKFSLRAVGNIVIEKLKEIQPNLAEHRAQKLQLKLDAESQTPPTWFNTNPPSWTNNWGNNIIHQQEFVDSNGKMRYRIKINNN